MLGQESSQLKFLNLGARKFHFTKYRKHFLEKIEEIFTVRNYFFEFGLKISPGGPIFNYSYSGIINNDSYNNIKLLSFILILHTFQQNLKRHLFFDYSDVSFNARPSFFK